MLEEVRVAVDERRDAGVIQTRWVRVRCGGIISLLGRPAGTSIGCCAHGEGEDGDGEWDIHYDVRLGQDGGLEVSGP